MTSETKILNRLVVIGHELDIYEGSWTGIAREATEALVDEAEGLLRDDEAWSDYEVALAVIARNWGCLQDEFELLRCEDAPGMFRLRESDVDKRQAQISGQTVVIAEMRSRQGEQVAPADIQRDAVTWHGAMSSVKRCRRALGAKQDSL